MFDDRAAGLDEIPSIHIKDPADVANRRVMDMAAHDPIGMVAPRRFSESRLEGADKIHRVFDLEFGPLRQGPIGESECPASLVKPKIQPKRHVVSPIAKKSDPARVLDDDVELVAMDHEQPLTAGRHMVSMIGNLYAAENHARITAGKFIVISRQENHPCPLADLPQELLQDVIVGLRPVPSVPEPPTVNYVANEVNSRGIIVFEEIQQKLRLAASRAQMDIREEEGAVNGRFWLVLLVHGKNQFTLLRRNEAKADSYNFWMTEATSKVA